MTKETTNPDKVIFESDRSMTIHDLRDISGKTRKLNVHAYRCGAPSIPGLNLTILNGEGAYLASAHLEKYDVEQLVQQIMTML